MERAETHRLAGLWQQNATADPDLVAELAALLAAGDEEGLNDRFYRTLAFGTGGLRGEIGAGPNRMNLYTVGQATQGLAGWLLASGGVKKVAIAHDSRIKSQLFARHAARVLAANGIEAWLYSRLMPTPALSFAVRQLGCGAGVCITASHNPAAYNGYKVYGADGCQITTETAALIQAGINRTDVFAGVKADDFDAAMQAGDIRWIPETVADAFCEAVLALRVNTGQAAAPLRIVYTPLHGAGLECVTRVLDEAGYSDVTVVPQQQQPDGNFPTCPYPNPEMPQAMELGLALAKEKGADLLLATDPDCDRVGVGVRHAGRYTLLDGNQVGVLLLDYVCAARRQSGSLPDNPVAVKTIVTTDMAEAVAKAYGVQLRNVLTGFKFIGEQIGLLEQAGEAGRYVFGFEESCGYLSGTHVRDKDAVNACLLLADMAAWYKSRGMTLVDAMEALYQTHGYYAQGLDSFTFPGQQGFVQMQQTMKQLRAAPLAAIAGVPVATSTDYQWDGPGPGPTGLPASDVLQYRLRDNTLVTVRPSGTEPKLKVYVSASREGEAAANEWLAACRQWMRERLLPDETD